MDSTGYEAGHASTYYSKRCGLEKSHYPKLTIVCDTESHLVLSAVADRGPLPDDAEFAAVVRQAHRAERFDCLLADAGYDSEKNHTFVREEIGSSSIIPPLRGRRNGKPPHGRYRREMFEDFPQSLYGQRWQVESCFSQDKRRFGSELNARRYESQCIELLMRVLVHNTAILWRAIKIHSCPFASFQHSRSDPFCCYCPDLFAFELMHHRE